jgi:hypothetical protein
VTKTNYLNNSTEGYTYDPIYELTQVAQGTTTTESYGYDFVGNRGVSPYSYNSSNELTALPIRSYLEWGGRARLSAVPRSSVGTCAARLKVVPSQQTYAGDSVGPTMTHRQVLSTNASTLRKE